MEQDKNMRVERLTLKNFRSHKSSELVFDWVNFVLGPNAAGKSSVQMAVEYALTGRCAVTDAGGRGREQLIRLGADSLAVEVTMSGKRYGRGLSKRGASLLQNGVLVDGEFNFGISKDVLRAVLDAGAFLDLPEKEQKALLCAALNPAAVELPENVKADVALVGHAAKPGRVQSIEDVDRLYKEFYDERTVLGRELKNLGAEGSDFSTTDEDEKAEELPAEGEIKSKLDGLRREKELLVARRGKAAGAYEAAQKQAVRNRAELAEIYSKVIADEAEEKRLIALAAAQPKAKELEGELQIKRAELATAEAECERVGKLEGECPTCHMPVSAKDRGVVLEQLKGRVGVLSAEVEGLQQELAEFAGGPEAERRVAEHRAAVVRQGKLLKEQEELAKVESADTTELDQQIAELGERITQGEAVLTRVQAAHRARQRRAESGARRAQLEKKLAACERLVEYFGPHGVRTTLVAGSLDGFVEKMNAVLIGFGYHVLLTLEPKYSLALDSPDPLLPPRTLAQLSESERFRFGVALQIALARATGVNLVVVDRADVLDMNTRPMLSGMLLTAAREHGVQSIVLSTSVSAPPASPPEGVRVFVVRNEDGISEVDAVNVEAAA